jgi:hypothetical protein
VIILKGSKIISYIIGIVQLVSSIALIAGMHVMLGVFSTALPSGEQGIEIQFTDPVVIPFTLKPVNNGYLDATMEVSLSMIVDGVEVASDSDLVTVPSGSMVPVDLELTISLADAQKYLQEGVNLEWETDIRVSTLNDLISFNNYMVVTGGAS